MKTAATVVLVALLAAGGNVLFQRYATHVDALSDASLDWPAASGLVTHSELEYRRNEIGTGEKTNYDAMVRYEYVIDDQLYSNDVVRFDQGMLSNDRKRLLVSEHPIGKRVAVYYNPDDPGQSVLVRGTPE